MNDIKHWLTSRTIWISAIGVLLQVLHLLKIETPLDTIDTGALADHMVNLVSAVLFIAAGVFRAAATKKLSG